MNSSHYNILSCDLKALWYMRFKLCRGLVVIFFLLMRDLFVLQGHIKQRIETVMKFHRNIPLKLGKL